jgi:hypothetical protein
MQEEQEIISYQGVISFSDISELLNQLKEKMDSMGEKLITYKRIIILMVEILENIKKYIDASIDNPEMVKKYPTIFTVVKNPELFCLTGKNIIKKSDEINLSTRIEKVNSLDITELRTLYRQVISNGQFSMEGGAGLGFIELAKTSERKIRYTFEPINDNFSYYTINVEISC